MSKTTPLLLLAALGAAIAAPAQGAVTVLGGGMAHACSLAARAGESERRYEEVCTMALESELLNTRDRAGTYVNRGVLKLRRSEWDAARYDFNRAAQLKPDMGEAYVNRGASLIAQKRYAEGRADIDKGLELGLIEPAKAHYNRALANEGLGDLRAAYLDYRRATELSPEWEAPRTELSRFSVKSR